MYVHILTLQVMHEEEKILGVFSSLDSSELKDMMPHEARKDTFYGGYIFVDKTKYPSETYVIESWEVQ